MLIPVFLFILGYLLVKLNLNDSFVYLHFLLLPLEKYQKFVLLLLKFFIPRILSRVMATTTNMVRRQRLTMEIYFDLSIHFLKNMISYAIIFLLSYDCYRYGLGVIATIFYFLPFLLFLSLIYHFISFYVILNLKETGWYSDYYNVIAYIREVERTRRRENYVYIEFDL